MTFRLLGFRVADGELVPLTIRVRPAAPGKGPPEEVAIRVAEKVSNAPKP